jgi:hypothetical protein
VPYDGDFARAGLIASGSRELLVQVVMLAKGKAAEQK